MGDFHIVLPKDQTPKRNAIPLTWRDLCTVALYTLHIAYTLHFSPWWQKSSVKVRHWCVCFGCRGRGDSSTARWQLLVFCGWFSFFFFFFVGVHLVVTERQRWHFLIKMFLPEMQCDLHHNFSTNFCQIGFFKKGECEISTKLLKETVT